MQYGNFFKKKDSFIWDFHNVTVDEVNMIFSLVRSG